MTEEVIVRALDSRKSVIVFGDLGRYPTLLEFYLRPHVIPKSRKRDEAPFWFLRNARNVFMWVEPPFGSRIPNQWKYVVFTSHLDLEWDPSATEVMVCKVGSDKPMSWIPDALPPFTKLKNVFQPMPFVGHMVVNFEGNAHETYLDMLDFEDSCPQEQTWSISWPIQLKQSLSKHLTKSTKNFEKFIKDPLLAAKHWLPPPW